MSKRRTHLFRQAKHTHQTTSRKSRASASIDSVAVLIAAAQQVLAQYPIRTPAFQQLRKALNAARAVYEADVLLQPWTPFLCEPDPRGNQILRYWNSRYLVHVRRYQHIPHPLVHLSIKRHDQQPHIAYRELMRIKGAILGEDWEAVFLLPARSREVDLANQTHLWCVDQPGYQFPLGFFDGRLVSDVSINGTIQEPWAPDERPADCLSEEVVRQLFQKEEAKN